MRKRTPGKRSGDPLVAVAYLRVSTDEQHLGPVAQREAIEAWAKVRRVRVAEWCEDKGVSGGAELDKRPALMEALAALREQGAGLLVVAKRDRLARDVMKAAMAEQLAAEAGARVVSADGVGEGAEPEDALLRTIVDAFAQYERARIRARVVAAMRVKKQRGEFLGEAPIGTRRDGALLAINESEAEAVERIGALRAEGLSIRAIAAHLNRDGPSPRGRRWYPTTVARVLARIEEADERNKAA